MSNYTKTTDFAAKDTLPSGDSGKIIRGSEFGTEFDNIATAIASKSDSANPNFTGSATINGDLTVTGDVKLRDTDEIQLGNAADLKISHSGGGSTVENDTGNLTIKNRAVDGDIYFQSDDGTGVGTDTYFFLDGGEKKTKFLENVLISGDLETTGAVTTADLTATGVVDFSGASSVIGGVPSGGTTGQILAKNSNTNYDVGFVDPADVATLAATNVTVADAGGYYTSNNVEGALQEIGAQPPGFDPNTDSFNIGSDAVSSGTDSIALGHDSSSSNIDSIAIGRLSVASGEESIAIGRQATASTNDAVAIGQTATASGLDSIAIGEDSEASGEDGIAIGQETVASGYGSTALGVSADATAQSATALGERALGSALNSTAVGYDAEAIGASSIAIGDSSRSSGVDAIALGPNTIASGGRSISIGDSASATGGGSTALGKNASVTGGLSTALGFGATVTAPTAAIAINDATASGIGSMAIHDNSLSSGSYSIAIGYWSQATATSATAVGYSSEATAASSTALGNAASATGDKSIAIGFDSSASFVDAIAIGNIAGADALGSIAIGTGSDASQLGSVALGKGAQATGAGSTIAIGEAATTSGGLASPIAIGYQANTTGAYGVGLGYQTVTSGAQSIAIGYIASATNDNSIAIGRQLTVAGQKAVGIGWGAVAGSYDSIGIGTSANASTTDCISIGASSSSLATGGIAIGNGASISAGNIKGVAVGYAAQAQQIGGVAVGNNAICNSQFGTALGRDSNASSGSYATALGYGSVASDYGTAINNSDATGARSVAIGHSAVSSSADSIAIGYNADALGTDSIAIGNIAGADAENTIHINASGVDTNQPQTAGYIVIETDDASLKYDGSWDLTGGPLNLSGGIDVGGDVAFGDNDKAIFGAGSDLQIYHDGSHNFIEGTNAGNIYIRNALDDGDIIIQSDNGSGGVANYIQADGSNGEVRLFHYGSEKLNTTSTGIDVTGTTTTDGLTVQTSQGNVSIPTNTSSLNFDRAGSNYIRATDASGSFTFITGANDFATQRMKLVSNGDMALYEDTGTTAKFQWSASDESLSLIKTASGVTKALKLYNNTAGANNRVGIDFHTASTLYGTIEAGYGATSPEMNFKVGGVTPSQILKLNSTGIDVSGTVSADGLTVDGIATLRDSVAPYIKFEETGVQDAYLGVDSGNLFIRQGALGVNSLTVGSNNDISFYEDTGTTAKFFWDSSAERLGLGTTSPSGPLHIATGDSAISRVVGTNASGTNFGIANTSTGAAQLILDGSNGDFAGGDYVTLRQNNDLTAELVNVGANDLLFSTSNDEKMRITSAGQVGIGNDSPSALLTVGSTTDTAGVVMSVDNGGYSTKIEHDADKAMIYGNSAFRALAFGTDSTEAMRIDSSQNLLVGTTEASTWTTTAGFVYRPSSSLTVTRSAGEVAHFNRLTSDGTIADFRKGGTTVGSIGTFAGDMLIGLGDHKLRFFDSSSAISPCVDGGTVNDGTIDLGVTNSRFKDIYLSGGAYLGGVAAGNKLDDYEEGTWTPQIVSASGAFTTVTYSVQHGTYTKIGDTVRLTCVISTSNVSVGTASGAITITGNPFAFNSAANAPVSGFIGTAVRFATDMPNLRVYGNNGQYSLALQKGATNATGNFELVDVTDLTTGATSFRNYFSATIVFKTA